MKKVLAITVIASILTLSFAFSAFAGDKVQQRQKDQICTETKLCLDQDNDKLTDDRHHLAQKALFYTVTNGSSDLVTDVLAGGSVSIINPEGRMALVIQGKVKGLEPKTEYSVWVRNLTGYTGTSLASVPAAGYYKLAVFTTNKHGNANFRIRIKRDNLPANTYILQVAVNKITSAATEITVAATKLAAVSVVIAAK